MCILLLSALSQKYTVAVGKETPVMLPAWVEDVWAASTTQVVTAQDKRFSHHKCLAMQVSQPSCCYATVIMSDTGRHYLCESAEQERQEPP